MLPLPLMFSALNTVMCLQSQTPVRPLLNSWVRLRPPLILPCVLLGTDGGFGFGWEDITIYKLGVDYAY